VSLSRIDLNWFNKSYKKSDSSKNYFPRIKKETRSETEETINDILNFLRPTEADNNYNDFENVKSGRDPSLKVFVKESFSENRILSHLQIRQAPNCNNSILVFVPVLDDQKKLAALYVILGGHAWISSYKLVDFDFLLNIPLQIAEEKGASFTDEKHLLGTSKSKREHMKRAKDLTELDIGVICTSFVARIRKNINDELFPKLKHLKGTVEFQVTEGSLTFHTGRLTIEDVQKCVPILDKIFQDRKKYPISTRSKLRRFLLRVPKKNQQEILQEFKTDINEQIADSILRKRESFQAEALSFTKDLRITEKIILATKKTL